MSESQDKNNIFSAVFNVDTLLNGVKWLILVAMSFYASLLTIVSFHSDIKDLLDTPKKIDDIEKGMGKAIIRIEDKQKEIDGKINNINLIAEKFHSYTLDEDGYRLVRIRMAHKEIDALDKNSIYFDGNSRFFPELKNNEDIQNYKVVLKNMNNLFTPTIIVKIREKTNNNDQESNSDITFQVSKAIFIVLGGKESSSYLDVKAKVIYD